MICRRHKPCRGQPCVLTVDFESELRLTWCCRLCCFLFFPIYLFIWFWVGVAKGCEKDTLPSRLSSRICPRLLLCPLSLRPNMTSWLRICASGPCGELLRLFFFPQPGRIRTIGPQYGGQRERKSRDERQEEMWQQRDCGFKVSTSHSCCITRVREGFLGWRCPNGLVLIWIHRQPISACHYPTSSSSSFPP